MILIGVQTKIFAKPHISKLLLDFCTLFKNRYEQVVLTV